MRWTKSLLVAGLLASYLTLSHCRALPAVARNDDDDDNNLGGQSLEDWTALLRRLDDAEDWNFDKSATHWSRQGHQLSKRHDIRAALSIPKPIVPKPDVPPVTAPKDPTAPNNPSGGLDPTKPNSTPSDPDANPGAGLDPTKPKPTSPNPETDPGAGLDPTKPKDNSNPSPSAPPADPQTPAASGDPEDGLAPKPSSDSSPEINPDKAPDDLAGSSCGQSQTRKRAPGGCGTADALSPPAGSLPDAVAPTRAGRPGDRDVTTQYDYLDEVIREKDTGLVNDKLTELDNLIANPAPSRGQVRTTEIDNQFRFGSTANGPAFRDIPNAMQAESHGMFQSMFARLGVTRFDNTLAKDTLTSGNDVLPTAKMSWTQDQQIFWDDFMRADLDTSALKPHMTEKRMAILQKNRVNPQNIRYTCQTDITNPSSHRTLEKIFEKFGQNPSALNDALIFERRSPDNPAQDDAFDAYFRTPNGKEQLNDLLFYPTEWGFRRPRSLLISRLGTDPENMRFDVAVFLEIPATR